MDITKILVVFVSLLATILSAFGVYIWTKYVKPWLEQHGLTEAAKSAVYAAETLLGRYCGEQKWQMALEKMKSAGWNIDTEEVLDAIRAAWQELNISQVAAGVKESS